MRIVCPGCGRDIPSVNVNIQSMIAKCEACGEVFNFAEQVPGAPAVQPKPTVDMPKGFTTSHQLNELVITHRWFSAQYIALLVFCIFWDGVLVFWYTIAFSQKAPLLMFIFPVIHLAMGVFLTYTVLAGFLNRTESRINPTTVSVRHYLLPWPGNKVIPSVEIDQLFGEEKVHRKRRGTSITYEITVVRRGGERVSLITGLDSPNHARFIEQQIEA